MPKFKATVEGTITYTILVEAESEEDVYTMGVYEILDEEIVTESLDANITEVESFQCPVQQTIIMLRHIQPANA